MSTASSSVLFTNCFHSRKHRQSLSCAHWRADIFLSIVWLVFFTGLWPNVRHTLTHTSKKPYKCNQCCATFTQKVYLKDHQESHKNSSKHRCEICINGFNKRRTLRIHTTHTKVKLLLNATYAASNYRVTVP